MKYLFAFLFALLLAGCSASQYKNSKYKTVEYEAGPCFGFCPIYKIKIEADRTAVFDAQRFNFSEGNSREDFAKPPEGKFTATIKPEDYQKLITLLDGLDAKNLEDKYGDRRMTDLPTSYLRLTFSDGSTKNIEDYGKHGTEKLSEIYRFFDDLRKNQDWKKVE